jgi:hypothetical protein
MKQFANLQPTRTSKTSSSGNISVAQVVVRRTTRGPILTTSKAETPLICTSWLYVDKSPYVNFGSCINDTTPIFATTKPHPFPWSGMNFIQTAPPSTTTKKTGEDDFALFDITNCDLETVSDAMIQDEEFLGVLVGISGNKIVAKQ